MRAIFSECSSREWVDAASSLAERYGWEPCYWTAASSYRSIVRERFPSAVFHYNYDAARNIPPDEFRDLALPAVDQDLLRELAFDESILLTMMDRMDPGYAFSHRERTRLYHDYLRYWTAVLDRLRPDVFVTPGAPHLAYDYVLYVLCKRRGIRTIVGEYTCIPGLVFAMERFEDGSTELLSRYAERLARRPSTPAVLSAVAETYLQELSGNYEDAMPFYMKAQIQRAEDEANPKREPSTTAALARQVLSSRWLHLDRYGEYLQNAYRNFVIIPFDKRRRELARARAKLSPTRLYRQAFVPEATTYLKQRGRDVREHLTPLDSWRVARRARTDVAQLRARYDELAGPVDLARPYVFVALHYQPERSTSPQGGVFADQVLLLDLLAKCLPSGWNLYVKEHLSQVLPFFSGHLCRTPDDYDRLARMPSVRLASLSYPSFELIDAAQAVVTVSGTVGWEAVCRGRPTLTFGHAWYKGCEGVFYTPTERECRETLARIAGGYKVDPEKVRLFIEVLERVGFRGYFDADFAEFAGVSPEENRVAIADALHRLAETRGRP